jgi:hypothetical protein
MIKRDIVDELGFIEHGPQTQKNRWDRRRAMKQAARGTGGRLMIGDPGDPDASWIPIADWEYTPGEPEPGPVHRWLDYMGEMSGSLTVDRPRLFRKWVDRVTSEPRPRPGRRKAGRMRRRGY